MESFLFSDDSSLDQQGAARIDRSFTPSSDMYDCFYYDVGRQSYTETLRLQLDLHQQCKDGRIEGAIIAVEHEPVITCGARTAEGNLLAGSDDLRAEGIELVQTDRGGDITYHGPGQLVVYPILNLRKLGSDVHEFLRLLEESVVATLAQFGLSGQKRSPASVWVGERKICSIGIAVRRQVTYHGLALNVSTNMRHFQNINPCGLTSAQMTSMAELITPCPSLEAVKEATIYNIAQVFGLNLITDPGRADV